jgi:hypothetical protein
LVTMHVPVKTPQALAELSSRQRQFSQRHRTVLLLLDGRRSEGQVRKMALQAGAAESCFDDLVAHGLIAFVDVAASSQGAAEPSVAQAAAALRAIVGAPDSQQSALPASLSLQPSLNDSVLNEPPSTDMGALDDSQLAEGHDEVLEEARRIMIRAVRAESPVAGTLTVLRLRRAGSRDELESLLGEVEHRITKPFKGLWASQTMQRVKELLSTQQALA